MKHIRWTAPAGLLSCRPSRYIEDAAMNDVSRSFRGNSNAARDIAHHLHPYTNFKKHESDGPLIIVRGKGVYVIDDDGKEYIEGMAGLWWASLGFGNERLADGRLRADAQLPFYHAFNQRSHEPAIDLAEKLLSMAPVPMSKVFFANSGSEANDTVIKMVWYFNNALGRPQKKKIISPHQGLSRRHRRRGQPHRPAGQPRDFDLPIAGILHTELPALLSLRQGRRDRGAVRHALRRGARAADPQGRRPDTVAAIIGEPVMGAGGVIVPPKGYFEKIQAVLQEVRRAADRRRGDLRLRPHRQRLGLPDHRHQAGHPDLRQGAVGLVPADLGGDGQRAGLPGADDARATRSAPSATASPIPAIRSPPPSRSRR